MRIAVAEIVDSNIFVKEFILLEACRQEDANINSSFTKCYRNSAFSDTKMKHWRDPVLKCNLGKKGRFLLVRFFNKC